MLQLEKMFVIDVRSHESTTSSVSEASSGEINLVCDDNEHCAHACMCRRLWQSHHLWELNCH